MQGNDKVIEILFNLKQQQEQEALEAQKAALKAEAQNFKSTRTQMNFQYTKRPMLPYEKEANRFIEPASKMMHT